MTAVKTAVIVALFWVAFALGLVGYGLRSVKRNALRTPRTVRAAVVRSRARRRYAGSHRPTSVRAPFVDRAWRVAYESRIADWLREHAQPVMLSPATVDLRQDPAPLCPPMYPPAPFERKAVVAALRYPTCEMPVPDFDTGPGHYDLSAGHGRYGRLRPALLDAEAEQLMGQPRAELEAAPA